MRRRGDVGSPRAAHERAIANRHPVLGPAAVEAARRSKYRAYVVNGSPVEVRGELEFNLHP